MWRAALALAWVACQPADGPTASPGPEGSPPPTTTGDPTTAPVAPPSLVVEQAWAHSFWGYEDGGWDPHLPLTWHEPQALAVDGDGGAWIVGHERHDGGDHVPKLLRAEPSGEPGEELEVGLEVELCAATASPTGEVLALGQADDAWWLADVSGGVVATTTPVEGLAAALYTTCWGVHLLPLSDGTFLAATPDAGGVPLLARLTAGGAVAWAVELPVADTVRVLAPAGDERVLLAGTALTDDGTEAWWRFADPVTGALEPRVARDKPGDTLTPLAGTSDGVSVTLLISRFSDAGYSDAEGASAQLATWADATSDAMVVEPDAGFGALLAASPGPEGSFVLAGWREAGAPALCWVHPSAPTCLAELDLELPLLSGTAQALTAAPDGAVYAMGTGSAEGNVHRTWLARVEVELTAP